MISWDLEGVHLSESIRKDPAALERLRPTLAVARVLARHIQERLAHGDTATPAKSYKGDKGYRVSKEYADRAGVEGTRFASSREFHAAAAGAKPGVVTGGLLKSIRVRNRGRDAAVIEASGSSLARSRKLPKGLKDKIRAVREHAKEQIKNRKTEAAKQKVRERRDAKLAKLKEGRPRTVQNREKLSTVWKQLGTNLVQPTDTETDAIVSAVAGMAHQEVADLFGATVESSPNRGDARLLRKLKAELERMR
ncbi:MAG: hypothetical protein H6747_09630 [Deltaproteobacteria bacterium]|nr:hypothetical protein [Deltaproteobacteria bacterium]